MLTFTAILRPLITLSQKRERCQYASVGVAGDRGGVSAVEFLRKPPEGRIHTDDRGFDGSG